jgi:hypothetical protein
MSAKALEWLYAEKPEINADDSNQCDTGKAKFATGCSCAKQAIA